MDVSKNGTLTKSMIITGHDRNLNLRNCEKFERVWEKRPDPNRKTAPNHLRVILDPTGTVAATSSTDRQISIFESETGKLLCKAQCGEITTGMCFSQNGKHLISTSSLGVIYIWKLPDVVTQLLLKYKEKINRLGDLNLHQIEEEEFEDSIAKKVAAKPPVSSIMSKGLVSAKTADSSDQPQSAVVANDIQDVLAQIGAVNNVVRQIEDNKTSQAVPVPRETEASNSSMA